MLSTSEGASVSRLIEAAQRAWNCRNSYKTDGEQSRLYNRPYPRQSQATPVEVFTRPPRTPPHQQRGKWCHFHQLCSHDTSECRASRNADPATATAEHRCYNCRQYASQCPFPSSQQGQNYVPPTAGDSFHGTSAATASQSNLSDRCRSVGVGTDDLLH